MSVFGEFSLDKLASYRYTEWAYLAWKAAWNWKSQKSSLFVCWLLAAVGIAAENSGGKLRLVR